MGEIIHFDFKNKKVIKNQSENEPDEKIEADKKELEQIAQYEKFTQFLLSGDAKKLMRLPVSPTSFQEARELVKNYKTDELIGWLEKTDENEWKKKAAFFRAIFAELRFRLDKK